MPDVIPVDQRVAAGVPAELRFYNVDGDGAPVEAAGAVTVAVATSSGGEVLPAGTATSAGTGDDAGTYTVTLTAAQTATLGTLVATWSIAGAGTFTTTIEIVGRHTISIAELTALQPSLAGLPTVELVRARLAAELEVEWICDRSFVRRARTVTLDGTGDTTLWIPDWDLATVDTITVDGTALEETVVAGLYRRPDRALEWPDGDSWAWGRGNVVLGYTYGLTAPPQDLKPALAVRIAEIAHESNNGVLARARTYNPEGGGSYELDRADRFRTGNPDVDAVYQRYSKRPIGDGSGDSGSSITPASRSIEMTPQYGSLFHGGRL